MLEWGGETSVSPLSHVARYNEKMVPFNQNLIVVFASLGLVFACFEKANCSESTYLKSENRGVGNKHSKTGRVVLVSKPIKRGSFFTKDNLKEDFCAQSKIEDDDIEFIKYAIGKRASRDLSKGKHVDRDDIILAEGVVNSFVFTVRDIPANTRLQRQDVTVMTCEFFRDVKPQTASELTSYVSVIGKKTRFKMSKSQRILSTDLLPE